MEFYSRPTPEKMTVLLDRYEACFWAGIAHSVWRLATVFMACSSVNFTFGFLIDRVYVIRTKL